MKHTSKKLAALLLALLLLPLIPIQAQEQPDFDSVVAQANDGYIAYHGFNLRRKPLIAFDENQEDQSLASLLNAKELPATEAAQDYEEQTWRTPMYKLARFLSKKIHGNDHPMTSFLDDAVKKNF